MINPEQIPYEVKMKLRAVLLDGETDEAVAIAAAINVWPGWFSGNAWPDLAPTIVLPLSHENNDD